MIVSAIQFKTEGTRDIKEKAFGLIEDALKDNPDFIVLPELFETIYFPQYKDENYFKLAESIPGETTRKILDLIKGKDTIVIAPVFERSKDGYFCSCQIIDSKKGFLGNYRKLHIPSGRNIYETYYFKKGNLGHKTFTTRKANISIMLCYDRHFPESARIYGLKNTDILFVSAATPDHAKNIWSVELQAHAYLNGYWVVCSNRSGKEDKISFLGSSLVCNYRGEIDKKAGEASDEILKAYLNIEESRRARKELTFYNDRRPEIYQEII